MWCYFELVNGSTANSELNQVYQLSIASQVAPGSELRSRRN
jgi:hypothetical protein